MTMQGILSFLLIPHLLVAMREVDDEGTTYENLYDTADGSGYDDSNFSQILDINNGTTENDPKKEQDQLSPPPKGITEHGEGFLVGLLDKEQHWRYVGSLIRWNTVLTTCTAALSRRVEYVCFRTEDPTYGWLKRVKKFDTDRRCLGNNTISNYLRYNVGILQLKGRAEANAVTRLLQYPALSKQKYLRLTDQVINRRLNCSVTFVTNKTGWKEIQIQAMPSNELVDCLSFIGLHEFICAQGQSVPFETININQGMPVLCGEDAYGVLVAPEIRKALEESEEPTTTTFVLMRLDEFLHLIVKTNPSYDFYS